MVSMRISMSKRLSERDFQLQKSVTNVLFVSKSNACRSLLAEACLRHHGGDRFKVFSCGAPQKIEKNPDSFALLALQTAGISSTNLSCKAWTDFTRSGAPKMDFVIALDSATTTDHPIWPGQPVTALWDYPALNLKSAKSRKESAAGFLAVQTLVSLRRRVELLVCLHSRVLKRGDLEHDLRDLAHM